MDGVVVNTSIPGLARPWRWIQPKGTDEILRRLLDARDLNVLERERENMCSVAHGEIVRLRALVPDFHDDKPDGRPDLHASTEPGDLDTFGRPLRPGR